MDDYYALYRATALALKQVCPACRIGGPAILTPFIAPFINYLATTKTPADFLSVHAYGVLKIAADAQGRPGAPLDPSPLAIVRTVRAARLVTDRSALPTLPLHLTEWSPILPPRRPLPRPVRRGTLPPQPHQGQHPLRRLHGLLGLHRHLLRARPNIRR